MCGKVIKHEIKFKEMKLWIILCEIEIKGGKLECALETKQTPFWLYLTRNLCFLRFIKCVIGKWYYISLKLRFHISLVTCVYSKIHSKLKIDKVSQGTCISKYSLKETSDYTARYRRSVPCTMYIILKS